MPLALGTGSKARVPSMIRRRERSHFSSGTPLPEQKIAVGWEEEASPKDEKAACWVAALQSTSLILGKAAPYCGLRPELLPS